MIKEGTQRSDINMLALIPYFPPYVNNTFGIALDSWSLLVSLGFIVGLEFARARALRLGLDIKAIVDGGLFVVGMGFVGGHLVHVLAYHPELIDERGWIVLLEIWAGFSSNGGFLGAIVGTILWFGWVRKRPFWLHADTIAYALPFGWFLGRVGCFTAHDHVGARSDFFLAVDFPARYYGGPRHDLGLYEALYVFCICIVFWLLRAKPLRHSSFAMLFCLLYAPARFCFDFLRNADLKNADIRWAGLTPAQYGSILLFVSGLVLWARLKNKQRYTFVQKATEEKESSVSVEEASVDDTIHPPT